MAGLGVLGLLAVAPASPLEALSPGAPLQQLVRQSWDTKDGLPQSSVQAMVQDRRGYLWLATQEGVARFDGVRFVVTDTRSVHPLPAANALCLLEGEDGVWIGTRGGGLSFLTWDGRVRTWGREAGLEGLQVRCLLRDGDGLLVGTRGGGLQRFDPATGRFSPPVGGLSSRLILDLARDGNGALWVATEGGGICRMADGRTECFGPREGFPSAVVRCVAVTPDGRVWAGTYGAGLAVLENGRWRTFGPEEGLRSSRVTELEVDPHGTLWVGTAGAGLQRLTKGRLEGFAEGSPLAHATVYSVLTDSEGNLWVGTEAEGLHCLRESVFGRFGAEGELPATMIRAVMESRDGSIWVGSSGGGLVRIRGREVKVFGRKNGLPADDVFSLYEDPRGRIWAGTYGGGLARLEGGRIRAWSTAEGLANPTVWALEGDGGDGVWAGTFGAGLYHVTERVAAHVGAEEGLPSDLVRCLRRSRDGVLWIGTASGVARLEGGRAVVPRGLEALAGVTVFDIMESRPGVLWLATNGDGLFRWNGRRLAHLGLEQGLYDTVVYRLLPDGHGGVWMTSNRGIARAALDDLEEVAEGRKGRVAMQVFGTADGLATAECNGGSQPAGWRSRDGKLWFPTPRGLAVVRPERAALPVPTPVMVLEELEADGRTLDPHANELLPAGTHEVAVTFTGLSFVAPDEIRFRYRLVGLSGGWEEGGSRRRVVFSRLPPGSYRFEVQARNRRSGWAEPPATARFRVRAFLWQMPVFWALAAVGLVLLGFALAQGASARLRRRAEELRTLVEDRTRDLLKTTLELEKANVRLEELSQRDPLTGLANRRHFDEQVTMLLREAARYGTEVSLMMVDVDRFKAYNDRYGHQEGDRCLERIARVMASRFARPLDLVARWGGEEFVVFLPGVDGPLAEALAEELRTLVEREGMRHEDGPAGVVTVSVGVASAVPGGETAFEDLLRRADAALYRAKEAGRNRVVSADGP